MKLSREKSTRKGHWLGCGPLVMTFYFSFQFACLLWILGCEKKLPARSVVGIPREKEEWRSLINQVLPFLLCNACTQQPSIVAGWLIVLRLVATVCHHHDPKEGRKVHAGIDVSLPPVHFFVHAYAHSGGRSFPLGSAHDYTQGGKKEDRWETLILLLEEIVAIIIKDEKSRKDFVSEYSI